MWAFFEDWRQFENRVTALTAQVDCGNVKKLSYLIFLVYLVMFSSVSIVICSLIFKLPEATYLLSHYKIVRDSLGFSVTTAYHIITIVIGLILISLSDFVP